MKDSPQTRLPSAASLMSAGIPADEAEYWVSRIRSLSRECGCSLGARFMVAALVLYPAAWLWTLRSFLAIWQALLVAAAVVFSAMGLGKLLGVLFARLRLRRVARQLQVRLAAASLRNEGFRG